MTNQILRLLAGLPRAISEEKEAAIKEIFTYRWRDTYSQPDYDFNKIKAADLMAMMNLFGVPIEFFTGTPEQIEAIIKEIIEKAFIGPKILES